MANSIKLLLYLMIFQKALNTSIVLKKKNKNYSIN